MRKSRENTLIREFILNNVEKYPAHINKVTQLEFGVSREAVNRYPTKLVDEGILDAAGKTKARKYAPRVIVDNVFSIELSAGLSEDTVWVYRILPLIKNVNQNIINICQYCFTEILNNAIDHSASKGVLISYQQTYNKISMMIADSGIGIFEKIQKDFHLIDARAALLELAKGKITSDEKNHAGQGIFFTSRMLDEFSIRSGYLYYRRERQKNDEWLIETEDEKINKKGTTVFMDIETNTNRTTREVFDEYQGSDFSFRKTHVPLNLGRYPGEELVSRSQAKRVLARFENFTEVMLDFKGVEEIGQAFADEIFRVFKNSHPDIKIITINTSSQIERMMDFVQAYDKDQKNS